KWTPRFSAPWMLCTMSFSFPDQPLLFWLGLWQKLQVAASLRWPAWKSGPTPSDSWQPWHFAVETIARRAVKPVAAIETSGAGTTRPPFPPLLPGFAGSFGVYPYFDKLVCVKGWLWSMKFSVGSAGVFLFTLPRAYVY